MTDTVIDSSVVAKWILPEADSAQAQKVFIDVVNSGNKLIILDLALPEVANSIWKRVHRGLINTAAATALLDMLLRVPVDVQPAAAVLSPALQIAVDHGRSVYD